MKSLSYQIIDTPIGDLLIAGTNYALTHVLFGMQHRTNMISEFLLDHPEANVLADNNYLSEARTAILNYLNGHSRTIQLATAPAGTDLQRRVWQGIASVPYGQVITYTELAERAGAPQAARAVANACGANPLGLVVPCHRIQRKGGDLGGFSGGLWRKEWLLAHEAKHMQALAA